MKPYSKTGSPCEHCDWRAKAEANPSSLLARVWRWHTKWCPGWRSYQKDLARLEQEAREREAGREPGGGT
jgi:hypothetical protein